MPKSFHLSLPYAHLNLRLNPFGLKTRPEKNQLVVLRINLAPYVEKLSRPGYAVQFLKEGARNKTTHLLAMRRHFPGAPYIRLYEDQAPPPIPEAPVLFIDWMHVLRRRERVRLLRRPSSFGIVSHVNQGSEFRRAGLDYDVIKLPVYTVRQMHCQVSRLIEWARRDPEQPVPTVSQETVSQLLARFGEDYAVLNYLYEAFERLTEVGDVRLFD